MSAKKSVRRAQAVKPFGPGAILDVGQESFVVLDTKRNRRAWNGQGQKITLGRLEPEHAPDGFRLPPVVTGPGGKDPVPLQVQRFPAWMFCPNCRRMEKATPQTEEAFQGNAPRCKHCGGSTLVPMRYVAACRNGHLSDIDWWRWAHSRQKGSAGQCTRSSPILYFRAQHDLGSSNKALAIECGRCGATRTLEDITKTDLTKLAGQRCSGRQPWQRRDDAEDCSEAPRALLRSQTAVHFDDMVSALDLEEHDSGGEDEVTVWLREELGKFRPYMTQIPDEMKTKLSERASEIFGCTVDAELIQTVFDQLDATKAPAAGESVEDPLREEWHKLTRPTDPEALRAPLRVRASDWSAGADQTPLGLLLESVMLVERLREVRALRGFRRLDPGGRLIPPDLGQTPRQPWLPAIEVFGEGIFLRLSNSSVNHWEHEHKPEIAQRLEAIRATLAGDNWVATRFNIDPGLAARFVMLHTFSHLLIRQLTFECGYSGAALRERLYVFHDRLGVLIYTADADSEGSLGGLVRQGKADRIVDTIRSALTRADWCSNDPICGEMPEHGLEKLNLAACHACSLVAETSCTHLNLLLDRKLVVGDGEYGPRGYFRSLVEDT